MFLLVLFLFFLSGACALTYEVVWMRMLTLVFGATTFATSTILASFFAGLALGGWYFGRRVDQGRDPLLLYAGLEAGIALCAFAMPWVFDVLGSVYVAVSRQFGVGYYGLSLTRFVFSFLALVVPATLMGGTLPVMVKYFATGRDTLGRRVAWLYSTNTFGAVLGAMAAGFFLILLLGVKESAYAAGVVNLVIAGAVLAIWRAVGGASKAAETTNPADGVPATAEPGAESPLYSPAVTRLALIAIGVSGLCALALEVLWTRSLIFFLDNSTHAFTTILTAFLLGIALGSLLISRATDRMTRLVGTLGLMEVLIGISAILAIPVLGAVPSVFDLMAGAEVDASLPWRWMGVRFVTVLAVMLLPTLLMGMAFPLAAKIYARSIREVGAELGEVYAVNTMGGVLGSVLAGFVLIPLVGVQTAIALVAGVNLVTGLALLAAEPGLASRSRGLAVAGSAVAFSVAGGYAWTHGQSTLVSYWEEMEGPTVVSYAEGVGATVKVYDDQWGDRVISVNGFPVAGTAIEMQDAQKSLAHLPMLLSSVERPKVKIVGFGSGGTSWGMSRYDVERIDCVELVKSVPEQADYFPSVNHGVRNDPRYNLILGDGRNHALISDEVYDIISVDATSPKMAGNGSLYALEFYQLLQKNLSPQGIAVQWIPFHLLSDTEVRMIARSFVEAFPHTTLWFTAMRQYFVLLGTQEELRIDYPTLARKLGMETVQEDLAPLSLTDPVDILGLFIMDEESLREWVADAPLNTDNHPLLEFTPAMAYFMSDFYWLEHTYSAWDRRESVLPLVENLGATPEEAEATAVRLERRYEATQHSIRGDMLLFMGQDADAMQEYTRALEIDPSEKNRFLETWRN